MLQRIVDGGFVLGQRFGIFLTLYLFHMNFYFCFTEHVMGWGGVGLIPNRLIYHLCGKARVALLPKPGTTDFRPLSLLCVAWRIGAKFVTMSMKTWLNKWLDHRVLGGVAKRSVEQAHLRIWQALHQDHNVFVAEDLSKYFDSIIHPHLQLVLQHLGAPAPFQKLVSAFYTQNQRLFFVARCCRFSMAHSR